MARVTCSARLSTLALASLSSMLVAPSAHAVVVYSGTVNLAIPNTTAGLYVNVVNGTTYSGPGTFPTVPGPGANWDFNLFGSTSWSFFSPGSTATGQNNAIPATSRGYVAATTTGAGLNLAMGTVIGGSSVWNTGGPSAAALTTGTPAIFGFRFNNEGANLVSAADDTVHYGWARVSLIAGTPGTLVDYAFETTPLTSIQAGVVPEPSTWALMAGGLAGIAGWLRRRQRLD